MFFLRNLSLISAAFWKTSGEDLLAVLPPASFCLYCREWGFFLAILLCGLDLIPDLRVLGVLGSEVGDHLALGADFW